jgi:hypothetical protein
MEKNYLFGDRLDIFILYNPSRAWILFWGNRNMLVTNSTIKRRSTGEKRMTELPPEIENLILEAEILPEEPRKMFKQFMDTLLVGFDAVTKNETQLALQSIQASVTVLMLSYLQGFVARHQARIDMERVMEKLHENEGKKAQN